MNIKEITLVHNYSLTDVEQNLRKLELVTALYEKAGKDISEMPECDYLSDADLMLALNCATVMKAAIEANESLSNFQRNAQLQFINESLSNFNRQLIKRELNKIN